MSKYKKSSSLNCNCVTNQYLIMVTIYATIIAQEIEDDESLGILGSFLVALGEELALASEIRIVCKERESENNYVDTYENLDVFDRNTKYTSNKRNIKKRKRRRN